ncbi:hypothetical protein EI94DRAFT_1703746 [Lactarius quietus]|nr:hypothetical protein EI94DRAFT_1703746 [Lactarius quietus]
MSSDIQPSSLSTLNFQPIFEKALEEYKKKTGKDLTAHPLAAEIKGCNSPEAILAILEVKANELNQSPSRSSDERLTKWLNPTVNVLNALSATLGQGASLAAKSTVASRDVLIELFTRIENFFERLKIFTEVSPPLAVTNVLARNLADVLQILAIATRGMKERRTKTFLKKLVGVSDIEDALGRLTKLEQGELLTVIAQMSSDTTAVKDGE